MKSRTLALLVFLFAFGGCALKSANEIGLRYSTEASPLPDTLNWMDIGFAKELIHQKDRVVVISGGNKPVPLDQWDAFKVSYPYRKNIDRNLLFSKTAFYRSPNAQANCQGNDCITVREYRDHTWIELATPVCVDFIGGKTDMLKPDPGHLVVKTIVKCQALQFSGTVFELTDTLGNAYLMHATETGEPTTNVVLPEGFTLTQKTLDAPIVIGPFGGEDHCYFNIVGDHLGQGYHQYRYAGANYPEKAD